MAHSGSISKRLLRSWNCRENFERKQKKWGTL